MPYAPLVRRFVRRLLSFLRLTAAETELSREITAHLQLIEDDFAARGLSREDARLAARRAFGGVEQVNEHQRDTRSFRWLEDSRIDIKLGVRMLAKYPGLSMIGGVGLAVAIAIGAAAFSFFYAYIYAVPFEGGERVVVLENTDLDTYNEMREAMHDFLAWRREMKSVEEISAFRTVGRNLIVTGGSVEPVQIAQITATGFNLPRVPPLLGRPLLEQDQAPGAAPVVVIGYDVWQSRFSSDPGIVGRGLRLGHIVHTIVGVMPEGFSFPVNHRYWTPLNTDTSSFGRREGPSVFIFGRLRDGATIEQAEAELANLGSRAAADFPLTHARLRPHVWPYAHSLLDIQSVNGWEFAQMQSLVSMLVVVVAVNVAALIYARTATRRGEIAVRSALGASRGRLIGQLFMEALVLCAVSAGAGLLLARFGLSQGHAIMEAEGNMPAFVNFGIPGAAMVYAAGMTLFAAIVAGVLPALHATGRRIQHTLRQTSGADGLRLGHTWTALIVAQVAIAVAGLPAAVTVGWNSVRSTMTVATYDDEPFLAAHVSQDPDAPLGQSPEQYARESAQRFTKLKVDLLARLEAEPPVADVTSAQSRPGDEPRARFEIDGETPPPSGAPIARYNHVAVDYFDAFGARVVAGRALTGSDAQSSPAVVVNQAFVNRILGGGTAIGRRLRYLKAAATWEPAVDITRTAYEIVGVVTDLQTNAADPALVDPVVYHAAAETGHTLLIRVRGADPAGFSARVRDITASLDPATRLTTISFNEMKRQSTLAIRLIVLTITLIVASALLLSAAGLYSLMSFTVSQRRKEIGIRAAMGADARQLLRSIFAKAAWQLGLGIACGIVLSLLLDVAAGGDMLGSFGRAFLPVMSMVMFGVGLGAAIGPARRGLRIQPTEALRAE